MTDASSEFAHRWLGLVPKDFAPTAYELLGLTPLEHDSNVIHFVANWRMASIEKLLSDAELSGPADVLLEEMRTAKRLLGKSSAHAEIDRRILAQHPELKAPPACHPGDGARKWLGVVLDGLSVEAADCRLLGVAVDENDVVVLETQFDQRFEMLRQLEQGSVEQEQAMASSLVERLSKARERQLKRIAQRTALTPTVEPSRSQAPASMPETPPTAVSSPPKMTPVAKSPVVTRVATRSSDTIPAIDVMSATLTSQPAIQSTDPFDFAIQATPNFGSKRKATSVHAAPASGSPDSKVSLTAESYRLLAIVGVSLFVVSGIVIALIVNRSTSARNANEVATAPQQENSLGTELTKADEEPGSGDSDKPENPGGTKNENGLAVVEKPSMPSRRPLRIEGDWWIEGYEIVTEGTFAQPENWLVFGDVNWTDYTFSAEVRHDNRDDGVEYAMGGRYAGGKDYWKFRSTQQGVELFGELIAVSSSDKSLADSIAHQSRRQLPLPRQSATSNWTKVSLIFRGAFVEVLINGRSWSTTSRVGLPIGFVFLGNGVKGIARWRNVEVRDANGALLWEGAPELPKRSPKPTVDVANSKPSIRLPEKPTPKMNEPGTDVAIVTIPPASPVIGPGPTSTPPPPPPPLPPKNPAEKSDSERFLALRKEDKAWAQLVNRATGRVLELDNAQEGKLNEPTFSVRLTTAKPEWHLQEWRPVLKSSSGNSTSFHLMNRQRWEYYASPLTKDVYFGQQIGAVRSQKANEFEFKFQLDVVGRTPEPNEREIVKFRITASAKNSTPSGDSSHALVLSATKDGAANAKSDVILAPQRDDAPEQEWLIEIAPSSK